MARVAPHAGAWIETLRKMEDYEVEIVAPHAGAWIETYIRRPVGASLDTSLPTRERGLKRFRLRRIRHHPQVAPHAGAWIETAAGLREAFGPGVAPHAGAWIETLFGLSARPKAERRSPRGSVD